MSQKSLYEQLGGEIGLKKLVHEFYYLMETLPEAKRIRSMHPGNLQEVEEKLFMFLSGWTGGPSLFIEKYGHPMLRRRHLPFAIGEEERDQWLNCMKKAMENLEVREPVFSQLMQAFQGVADHMRNLPEDFSKR